MTIYVVIGYEFNGYSVVEYSSAKEASKFSQTEHIPPDAWVHKIIQGTELTPDQLRNLAKKESK